MRTFARIRGKSGVPTLRKGPNGGWRVEMKDGHLDVKSYEDDPIFEIDEPNSRVVFTLKRGTYTPIAVYKAFVKIGLTLMPTAEIIPFSETFDLIREADHSRSWVGQAPIIHTFQNGPMANDRLTAIVLRRKPGITDVPYAYLVIGYGNDIFRLRCPPAKKTPRSTASRFRSSRSPRRADPIPLSTDARDRPFSTSLGGSRCQARRPRSRCDTVPPRSPRGSRKGLLVLPGRPCPAAPPLPRARRA